MKILIGYDGSGYSDFALDDLQRAGLPADVEAFVLTVGEAWELPFVVDQVSPVSGKLILPTAVLIEKHLEEVSEKAQLLAESAAKRLTEVFPAWRVTADAFCGKPAVELIRKADEWSPDLLVIGSHGRASIGRLILGSVSHKILLEANCPVRISRKNEYGENANTRIIVAVDGSANAEAVVKTVAGRNWSKDAEIRLIAVDDPFVHPKAGYITWNLAKDKPDDNQESREWIKKVIETPAEVLKSAGLQVSHTIRWGDAANMILEEAKEWQADTIFLGARGLGLFKRFLLGSVSSAVAANAKCTVEIVRSYFSE
jgi:nucleotide-binding universal stress UspA family protein